MKKYSFLWLILFTLPFNLLAQYNWQSLSNSPKSWRNDDIYFLNSQMGWAIHASYGYLTPHQFGQIYRTKDGGNTWQLMKDSSKTFYRAIGFADSLTGWVGNLADTSKISGIPLTTDTIPFYQTIDGGKTWSPVNLPYPHPIGICGISVVSDSIVYAYGRWSGPASYVKTIDKGKTWSYHDMKASAYGLVDGWFFNKDTGFITGASPTYKAQILSTIDGGNTWQICYSSTRVDTDEVWKIFFTSRDTGYASIEYQASIISTPNRYFVRTIDGGKTWTELPFISSYDEEGIGFINDTIGWIGGAACSPTYITYNAGNTWLQDIGFGIATPPYEFCSTGFQINRFRKLNDTLMFSSGNTIYKLSGKITGINELISITPQVNNYPNPYTTRTTIQYTLTKACHNVKLEAFAARGQTILIKDFGSQNSGEHEFIFEQGIPSGTYYYTITSDEYTITRKMIRVK